VLLVSALVHLGVLVLDVAALSRLADQREQALRVLLDAPADSDLDLLVAQAFAARQPTDRGGALSLLSRAFAAMGAEAGRVSVQDLRYSASDDAATLALEAPDLASLQAIETALAGAGLRVTAGAATTRDGAAEMQMTIRGGGA
jgi:type II secretory pathway component PulL